MRKLLVVLAGFLLTVACSKHVRSGVSVRSVFGPLVPPNTKALAAADIQKLKASAFYQRHQNDLNFPLLNAMSERVGMDPRRDLSYVLVAWNGDEPIAFARGDFKPRQLEPKLLSLGLRRTEYKSHVLFGDNREALTFDEHDIAIAGPAAMVRGEIDLKNGGIPDELQARLALFPASIRSGL